MKTDKSNTVKGILYYIVSSTFDDKIISTLTGTVMASSIQDARHASKIWIKNWSDTKEIAAGLINNLETKIIDSPSLPFEGIRCSLNIVTTIRPDREVRSAIYEFTFDCNTDNTVFIKGFVCAEDSFNAERLATEYVIDNDYAVKGAVSSLSYIGSKVMKDTDSKVTLVATSIEDIDFSPTTPEGSMEDAVQAVRDIVKDTPVNDTLYSKVLKVLELLQKGVEEYTITFEVKPNGTCSFIDKPLNSLAMERITGLRDIHCKWTKGKNFEKDLNLMLAILLTKEYK